MRLFSRILVPHRSLIPLKRFHFGEVSFCLKHRSIVINRVESSGMILVVYNQTCNAILGRGQKQLRLANNRPDHSLVSQLHAIEEFAQGRLYGQLLVPVFTYHVVCVLDGLELQGGDKLESHWVLGLPDPRLYLGQLRSSRSSHLDLVIVGLCLELRDHKLTTVSVHHLICCVQD